MQVTLDAGQDPSVHSAAPEVFRWTREIEQDVFSVESCSLDDNDAVVLEPGVFDGLWVAPGHRRATFRGTLTEWSLDAVGWLAAFLVDASHRHGVSTELLLAVRKCR